MTEPWGTTDVRSSGALLDRWAVSRDLWPGGTLAFWHGEDAPLPDRVFWPETEGQALHVLEECTRRGIPVVTYGAGSGVCGGARGRAGSVVLDTKALSRIGPLDETRRTVTVEAGVNGQHLEDWLNARGYTLGHSPSSIWCSTVGGWAAARSAGQFSSRYGVFEDMVIGLRAVSPGRGVLHVGVGGSASDKLMPLLLGSEGTLAVITSVTLRIWPMPELRRFRGYRFPDVGTALNAMRQLMQSELWPSVVRLYDPVDTHIGGKTKPKKENTSSQASFLQDWLVAVDRMPEVRKRLLVLPLSLPGVINQIFQWMSSGCLLIVGWEGDPEVVETVSRVGHSILLEQGEDLGTDPGERWFQSRHAVSYKLAPIFERGGFADTMEVAARWSVLEPLYNAVRQAIGRHAVVMAHMSHVYPEGGSIYFSFAGRGDEEVYRLTWQAALQAVLDTGGTVTHHHGVGELKAEAASTEVGSAVAGWTSLKAELDPAGILNPGRLFVPVDPQQAPQIQPPMATDGLVAANLKSRLRERAQLAKSRGGELMWPWETLPAPPQWLRMPWQVGWTEVSGAIEGQRCLLGRGPRSAAGPDLRQWLADNAKGEVWMTTPIVPQGEQWMGEARPREPWRVAYSLLHGDLRPACLAVESGVLRVGFRGPAARMLGELASKRVPGGLRQTSWRLIPLASGMLEPCDWDDPGIVGLGWTGPLRRRVR